MHKACRLLPASPRSLHPSVLWFSHSWHWLYNVIIWRWIQRPSLSSRKKSWNSGCETRASVFYFLSDSHLDSGSRILLETGLLQKQISLHPLLLAKSCSIPRTRISVLGCLLIIVSLVCSRRILRTQPVPDSGNLVLSASWVCELLSTGICDWQPHSADFQEASHSWSQCLWHLPTSEFFYHLQYHHHLGIVNPQTPPPRQTLISKEFYFHRKPNTG